MYLICKSKLEIRFAHSCISTVVVFALSGLVQEPQSEMQAATEGLPRQQQQNLQQQSGRRKAQENQDSSCLRLRRLRVSSSQLQVPSQCIYDIGGNDPDHPDPSHHQVRIEYEQLLEFHLVPSVHPDPNGRHHEQQLVHAAPPLGLPHHLCSDPGLHDAPKLRAVLVLREHGLSVAHAAASDDLEPPDVVAKY